MLKTDVNDLSPNSIVSVGINFSNPFEIIC